MRRAVEIESDDGCVLRGELLVGGACWTVLAHSSGEDLDVWRLTAGLLASDGFSVVAFDLRGHGGSDGDAESTMTAADLRSLCRYAKDHGARSVFVAAEGSSVLDALDVSAGGYCSAVVLIGPPRVESHQVSCARLVIARSNSDDEQAAVAVLRQGRGSAVVVHLPVDRSTSLLSDDWGGNVGEFITLFFRDQRLSSGLASNWAPAR